MAKNSLGSLLVEFEKRRAAAESLAKTRALDALMASGKTRTNREADALAWAREERTWCAAITMVQNVMARG